jgi:hypothetical protein
MLRRSLPVWMGGVVLLALLMALGLWFVSPGPTRANFNRLRVAMTAEEVEAIMGPPKEDFDPKNRPPPQLGPRGLASHKKWVEQTARVMVWHGKCGDVFFVYFDKAGRLSDNGWGNPNDD